MSRMLGKTPDDTGRKRDVSKKGMMWRHGQPLPLKASKVLTDVIELGEEPQGQDADQTAYGRHQRTDVCHGQRGREQIGN